VRRDDRRRRVSAQIAGASVVEIVAIDGGDDGVGELQGGEHGGDAAGLVEIDGQGAAGLDVAEAAGAGADVAQDHDGERAVVPTLADVGAARALADGVEAELLELAVISRYPSPPGILTRSHSGWRRRGCGCASVVAAASTIGRRMVTRSGVARAAGAIVSGCALRG
jgi:hypothetical protein